MESSVNHTKPSSEKLDGKRCGTCGDSIEFTGQPNLSGPVYFHIYRCKNCGLVRVPVRAEIPEGWG